VVPVFNPMLNAEILPKITPQRAFAQYLGSSRNSRPSILPTSPKTKLGHYRRLVLVTCRKDASSTRTLMFSYRYGLKTLVLTDFSP